MREGVCCCDLVLTGVDAWGRAGVTSVTKVRGKGEQLTINTRFEVNRTIMRWQLRSL